VTASDAELILRALEADDRAAFGELVRRHQSAVRRFLRHLSGDPALADDLAQETFVEAWRGLARFRGDASFLTWLLGIAHNRWRNAWRRRDPSGAGPVPEAAADPVPSPAPLADLRQDLDAALGRLSPEQKTAVHLCYQQGLSHSEIAAVLGWPVGTVKTHISRGKEHLRHALAAWNPST
jgi:RNA polymerase sigma-70 factor (ECF subfamily)